MNDFIPFAPVFGHDRLFFPEAKKRTPAQLALGDERYEQLAESWRLRLVYRLMLPVHRYRELPDSYVEAEDR